MNKSLLLLSIMAVAAAAVLAQKLPHAKSNEEAKALNEVFTATTVDGQIAAAEAVLEKYADTEFKSILLEKIAAGYMRKNDYPKTIVYGERSLEADPENYEALLDLGNEYAKITKENDLDRDDKLAKAEGYANKVLAIVPKAPKPNAQMTDAQWADAQKDLQASAHEILGMAALTRKKTDVAVTELKTSVDIAATPDPATYVRLAVAYNMAGKYDDAIAITEKVATLPNAVPQVKSVAQAEHVRAIQAKKKAAAAAATPEPAAETPKP